VTCRDAIALLGEYLEATLGASTVTDIEAHLRDCDECQAYLNTYRRTSELTRAFLISRLGRV